MRASRVCEQWDLGDQIGRVLFGQFFEKMQKSTTFFYGKSYTLTLTKMGWATFWAIFYNRIWSPSLERAKSGFLFSPTAAETFR
jgi:hypothetical protein